MWASAISKKSVLERNFERISRACKSVRVSDRAQRRKLLALVSRKRELEDLVEEKTGYAMLPIDTVSRMDGAVEFAKQVLEKTRTRQLQKNHKQEYRPAILQPRRYEEAPPIFDLALSDEILQIATEYLGQIPILLKPELWWTPVNNDVKGNQLYSDDLKGSQLYHRDGHKWLQRQAKFLFNMSDVDANSGPFTFLPADVSEVASSNIRGFSMEHRVSDEDMYRHVREADAIRLIGPAGTGAMVDSSRCFHYGARAGGKERLMLMFHFLSPIDVPKGHKEHIEYTPAFLEKFADDPVRKLVIPGRG